VKSKGKYGFIDKSGRYVIEPQFDIAFWYENGLAPVGIGRGKVKVGFINKQGKYAINPQFDGVNVF